MWLPGTGLLELSYFRKAINKASRLWLLLLSLVSKQNLAHRGQWCAINEAWQLLTFYFKHVVLNFIT